VRKLAEVLDRLVAAGHTLVLIEHNLDVVKLADWVIDMGPEAGDRGGEVVAMGRPEELLGVAASHTGRFLRRVLPEAGADGVAARPAAPTVPAPPAGAPAARPSAPRARAARTVAKRAAPR
jgi:excinuclease ABC subunit A